MSVKISFLIAEGTGNHQQSKKSSFLFLMGRSAAGQKIPINYFIYHSK